MAWNFHDSIVNRSESFVFLPFLVQTSNSSVTQPSVSVPVPLIRLQIT